MGVANRLSRGMSRAKDRQRRRSDERFAERFAQQWAQLRQERRPEEPPSIQAGESNYAAAQVPFGMDLAAAWSWRFLVVVGAGYVVSRVIAKFSVLVLPLAIALLLTALVIPAVNAFVRIGIRRGVASILVVIGSLAVISLLITFAGQQIAQGADDLAKQVVTGLEQIRVWLKTGPLHASDNQINDYIKAAQDAVTSSNDRVVERVTEVGTAVGHIVAGFFIILFATYFFLADGARIWAWVV